MASCWCLLLAVLLLATATHLQAEDEFENELKSDEETFGYESWGQFPLHRLETAPYRRIKRMPSYDVRYYPATKWACTSTRIEGYDVVTNGVARRFFMTLYSYIQGANHQNLRMRMTTPVTFHYVPATDRENLVTACFYLGKKYQKSPPKPVDPFVFIEDRQPMLAIVATRGGYPSQKDWETMGWQLARDSVKNGDVGYNFQGSYGVTYDSPFKFWHRRNELWFTKALE